MRGHMLVLVTYGVGQGSADVVKQEVREEFPGRSWRAAEKNISYFTTLSRILVVIRVPGEKLSWYLGKHIHSDSLSGTHLLSLLRSGFVLEVSGDDVKVCGPWPLFHY